MHVLKCENNEQRGTEGTWESSNLKQYIGEVTWSWEDGAWQRQEQKVLYLERNKKIKKEK